MIFLFATVGLVFAGPKKAKDIIPTVPISIPVKVEPSFEWPEARAACPVRSENNGLIQSKFNDFTLVCILQFSD